MTRRQTIRIPALERAIEPASQRDHPAMELAAGDAEVRTLRAPRRIGTDQHRTGLVWAVIVRIERGDARFGGAERLIDDAATAAARVDKRLIAEGVLPIAREQTPRRIRAPQTGQASTR